MSAGASGTGRARLVGAFYGLLAAALFGLSPPIAKVLLGELGPVLLAGLLYVGAGLGLSLYRALRPAAGEAGLRRADLPSLAVIVLCGGIGGPVLMLLGLQRTSALAGSLLLNLEAPLTIAIAVLSFREHLGRRAGLAAVLVLAGAAVLKLRPGDVAADPWGVLAIAGACACWALDNNLTQRLTTRDPFAVVRAKTLAAGTFNLLLGALLGERWPVPLVAAAALALGSLSYGVSVVLDAYALRLVGAAREAAYFATAPFAGALAAIAFLGEPLRAADAAAMACMAGGVALLLRDKHAHRHVHDELEHEHVHGHDDEHHAHEHSVGDPPGQPHSHLHRHARLEHEHPHVSDLHHRHRHRAE